MPIQLAEPEWTVRAFVARLDCSAHCGAVRTQAAVLRSLLDDIDRAGMERHATQLRDQIQEEALRLEELMARESSRDLTMSRMLEHGSRMALEARSVG